MKFNDYITIIIPVYNGESFIENIYRSIENQTYKKYKAIFINDGSSDGTLKKLQETFHDTDKYVIIDQKNSGVSSARNNGLKHLDTEYFTFIDVDDEIDCRYLEALYYGIIDDDTDLCVTNFTNKLENNNTQITYKIMNNIEFMKKFLFGQIITGVWGILIKTEIQKKYNIYFDEKLNYSEDINYIWKLLMSAKNIKYIENKLYIYNVIENSAMTKFNEKRLQSMDAINSLTEEIRVKAPDIYNDYHKYASNKIAWSVLWQAAHYLNYKDFKNFTLKYNFKDALKNLTTYPNILVIISSVIYLLSNKIYFIMIKLYTRKYRR